MLTANPIINHTVDGVQLIFQFSFEPIDYDGSFYSGVKDNHYRTVVFECDTPNYTMTYDKQSSVTTSPRKFKLRSIKTLEGIRTTIDFDDFHFEVDKELVPVTYEKSLVG